MARLNTTQILIKVSKLQKDNEDDDILVGSETLGQLEAIITELIGTDIIVEIVNDVEY